VIPASLAALAGGESLDIDFRVKERVMKALGCLRRTGLGSGGAKQRFASAGVQEHDPLQSDYEWCLPLALRLGRIFEFDLGSETDGGVHLDHGVGDGIPE
jgi:hypothetical protein